jgi:hypothetical protein
VTTGRGIDRWTVALGVALVVMLPVLLWLGRGMTFFADEWAFIESRSLGDPGTWLPPHNEHWSTLPILVYRELIETVGLHGLVVVLLFLVIRRTSGPIVALGASIILLAFGSGFENLFWGFQIGYVGATASGLAALLALDRRDALGRAAVAVFLFLGLTTAGISLAFFIAVAVESWLRGRSREMFVAIGVPAGIFMLWFIVFGRFGVTTRSPLSVEALLDVPGAIVGGLGNAAGAIAGVGPTLGLLVAAAIAACAAFRLSRDRSLSPRFVGAVAGIVALYALIGVTRGNQFAGFIDYTRYTYVASILLMVGLSALVGQVDVPAPGRGRLGALGIGGGLLAIALVYNVRLLLAGRELFLDRAAMTRALVTVALERPLPPSTEPDRTLVLVPSPASLERIVAAYGSPLGDSILPGAIQAIPPDVLAEARRRLTEGAELPR